MSRPFSSPASVVKRARFHSGDCAICLGTIDCESGFVTACEHTYCSACWLGYVSDTSNRADVLSAELVRIIGPKCPLCNAKETHLFVNYGHNTESGVAALRDAYDVSPQEYLDLYRDGHRKGQHFMGAHYRIALRRAAAMQYVLSGTSDPVLYLQIQDMLNAGVDSNVFTTFLDLWAPLDSDSSPPPPSP